MGKDVHSNTGMCPWPVGSHLFNDGQNPGEIWGGTTWEQIKEKFPLGCVDTHAAGTSGGEFEYQLTEQELPKVSGTIRAYNEYNLNNNDLKNVISGVFSYDESESWGSSTNLSSGKNDAVRNFHFNMGGDQPHNITPPIWRFTGGTGSPECVKGAA